MAGPARMRRLQELFHELVELPPAQRAESLDRIAAADRALAAELEALLHHDADQADSTATLADVVLPVARDLALGDAPLPADRRIGGYRLVREIGSGGMGSVYLAQRDEDGFQHPVAIKLVRGFPSTPVLERFRRERELLATLRHPNIARLFDGGSTQAGQPYLVMELVDGVPLDAWCRQRQAPLRQRLRLFQALCSAVQHAHQNLIVHRDLKPANVLVRADDEPVLLDFGIGKLLDGSGHGDDATRFHAMTPAYASPEQLRGEPATTLGDVFGLGLILFELLTGMPLRRQAGDTTTPMASQAAAGGEAWIRADARVLRGELDNIVRKALRDEPERRYASAAALAGDIQAWMDGRPVSAVPDGWSYRLRKFIRRHPVALGATALSIVMLVLLSVQLLAEREQARLEADNANQTVEFLIDLFKSAAPETTRGRELTARELIDEARTSLDGRRFSRPEAKARLESALGDIYHSLGLAEPSIDLLEAAVARIRAQDDAIDGRILAQALTRLTRAYGLVGRDDEAVAAGSEALRLNLRLQPAGHPDIGHSLLTLGVAEQEAGENDAARMKFEQAESLFAAAGQEYRENTAAAIHNRGWAAYRMRDFAQARALLERALDAKLEVIGPLHPSTFRTIGMIALTEVKLGEYAAAARRLEALQADQIRLLGEPNLTVASTYNDLGSAWQDAGHYTEAAGSYQAAIDQYRALGDDTGTGPSLPVNNYATLLEDMERFDRSEAMYRQALAMRRALGAQPPAIARGHQNLARLLAGTGRLQEAAAEVEAAWAVRESFTPDHHPERLDTLLLQARVALRQGDADAARGWMGRYQQAIAGHADVPAGQVRALEVQAEFAAARGDRVGEIDLRRRIVDAHAARLVANAPQLARQRLHLAAVLAQGGDADRDDARVLLEQARPPIEAQLDPDGPTRQLLGSVRAALAAGR